MLIDLRKIQTFWYGGIKQGRKEKIEKWLTLLNLKFEQIDPIIHKDGVIGCKESAKKTLKRSLEIEQPVLVMEDDCSPTKWFTPVVKVPDDADALYVGTSIRGLTSDWKYKNFKTDTIWHGKPNLINPYHNTYKVTNMLSTHAILYITKKYREFCINLIEYCVIDDLPCDIIFAEGMKRFNVYAVTHPLFYQDCGCLYTKADTMTPLKLIYEH